MKTITKFNTRHGLELNHISLDEVPTKKLKVLKKEAEQAEQEDEESGDYLDNFCFYVDEKGNHYVECHDEYLFWCLEKNGSLTDLPW